MSERELTIVKIAFNKVKEHFNVPVELKDITTEGESIVVTYNETDHSLTTGVRFTPKLFFLLV